MLLIISDLHLTDGTSGSSINPDAFRIFRDRLTELATAASWRKEDDRIFYQPIEQIDILLLGDILDVIRSAKWLRDSVRPWDNPNAPEFIAKVKAITDGILSEKSNAASFQLLKRLTETDDPFNTECIFIPIQDKRNEKVMIIDKSIDEDAQQQTVKVRIHYMIGNHDWFYALKGAEYDKIRAKIVHTLGLANDPKQPFAWEPQESAQIHDVLKLHRVYAQHGDKHDPFNYENNNRSASSLGDVIVIELLNRFPHEVKMQMPELPTAFLTGLQELDNVRPYSAIPIWINTLFNKHTDISDKQKLQIKSIWNDLATAFLKHPEIKRRDGWGWNYVDAFQSGLSASKLFSFERAGQFVATATRGLFGKSFYSNVIEIDSYYKPAVQEAALLNGEADFVVYGHTHAAETVPIRIINHQKQIYFNSGTWRTVFDMAREDTDIQQFMSYKVLNYIAFYTGNERKKRRFEVWGGCLADE